MESGASEILIRELRDTISELNNTITHLNESLAQAREREEGKDQEIANLKEQLDYTMKKLFGKKSEKNLDIPGQLDLFNEAEAMQDSSVPDEIKEISTGEVLSEKKERKKKPTDKERYAGIPVIKEYLDCYSRRGLSKNSRRLLSRSGRESCRQHGMLPAGHVL